MVAVWYTVLCEARPHGITAWLREENTEDPETRLGAGESTSKGNHIMIQKKGRIGSSFEDYLAEHGTAYEMHDHIVETFHDHVVTEEAIEEWK